MSISVRAITAADIEGRLPALTLLLKDSVNGGASLGFLAPLEDDEGRDYWRSLGPELEAGSRLLLAASAGDRLVGSGQLTMPRLPNARHRAELHKLFVDTRQRGQGIGRALMNALHGAARERGRSLILLNTRRGEPPEGFYKGLGYREVGVVPGYTVGLAGERYDTVVLYKEIEGPGPTG
ncbi:MAG: GNAT family N-acetyltransferase [Gemmatimonadota bacterium]